MRRGGSAQRATECSAHSPSTAPTTTTTRRDDGVSVAFGATRAGRRTRDDVRYSRHYSSTLRVCYILKLQGQRRRRRREVKIYLVLRHALPKRHRSTAPTSRSGASSALTNARPALATSGARFTTIGCGRSFC